MLKTIKPIKIGALVVVEGLDGLWKVLRRSAPNFYWVECEGQMIFVKHVFDTLYENGKLVRHKTEHRLTWRMYHPVYIFAHSREEAIETALLNQPKYIPSGTELHYGIVGGQPVGRAK